MYLSYLTALHTYHYLYTNLHKEIQLWYYYSLEEPLTPLSKRLEKALESGQDVDLPSKQDLQRLTRLIRASKWHHYLSPSNHWELERDIKLPD